MKRALFFCAILLILVSGCKKQDASQDENANKVNSVSIIIDELLWNGAIGDSIRNKFASPVTGLPQEEPLFTINQYPVKLLDGYMANSRNIIIIKKGFPNQFEITQDQYRKPQTVVRIYGRTSRDILNLIEEHAAEIISKIRQGEIAAMQKEVKKSLLDHRRIAEKFKVKVAIPSAYRYVMEKPKFLWLKKEITSGNSSLLLYEVRLSSVTPDANAASDVVRMRDSIGKLYIHGSVPDTHMITEDSYSPYLTTGKMCNRTTLETRGTWELDNDFMSGPFINYCIIDKPNNRILVLEGFCYAPSKEKRDLMLELEAILKSTKFLKPKA
jgi:hypothetical protein